MTAGKKKTTVNPRPPGLRAMEPPSESSGPSPDSSMTRASRQQEKEQLSGLNDRLASYIERVRNLEMENQGLHLKLREVEEVERHERSEAVGRYEERVEDLRAKLDGLAREKIRLEIERGSAVANFETLRDRLAKAERDLKFAQTESNHRYEQLQDVTGRMKSAENANANLIKENMELRGECEHSYNEANALRHQLENERVQLSEVEGQLAAYKEDLDAIRRVHSKEVDDLRRKRQSEIVNVSAEVETRYQTKLQEQLRAMREDFDARSTNNREELAALYANKISDYENQLENLHETVRELKGTNGRLINDYQDLLDLKVQLDTELQAYQKLLEGEETRLHIPPSRTPVVMQGDRRGVKRRRIDESGQYQQPRGVRKIAKKVSDAHGCMVIEDIDEKGAYIRLKNEGEADIPIGGWMIKTVGADKEVVFKFHSRQVIKRGATTTIWSSDAEQESSPPKHIRMKNQIWPRGNDVGVQLLNSSEVPQASYQLTYEWIEIDVGDEDGDEAEGEDNATANQENCTVM